MDLLLKGNLPFINVTIEYEGASLNIQNVLVDTGSASTIFAADVVATIGVVPELTDSLQTIQGVGGMEVVFMRRVDGLQVESCRLQNFDIEIGGMDYGFEINGIVGMDFLVQTGAIIDLRAMKIEFSAKISKEKLP
ncbi:MAG: retropepsin-like aspartic protease [Chloroflexi bacterium]|nr:retropepsin-like aspartic protease [Chloroflexota bacterium]